jgi:hypothetical protein
MSTPTLDATEILAAAEALPDGGWCVKERADHRYCVDVLPMMYNYRIVLSPLTPEPHVVYDHGWCYFGHGQTADGTPRTMQTAMVAALLAAAAWDGYGDPPGHDKQAF